MQEIEIAHLKVIEFQKKFVDFQVRLSECMKRIETLKYIPQMVERDIPLLVHFQICEGLRKTLDDIVPQKLSEFETNKLKEFQEFFIKYSGAEPNLKALSGRLYAKARELFRNNKQMVPFSYGKDYRPDMMHDEAN